jgi:opacity protein-like surface antigen
MNKLFIYIVISAIFAWVAGPAGAETWYLRGVAGLEKSLAADFSDEDVSAKNPPALFGTVSGNDGRPIGAYGDFGTFLLMEAAVGRRVLPWLRAELAVTYRPHMKYEGDANFAGVPGPQPVSSSADSMSALGLVYLDLAGMTKRNLGRFQPYIGGGAGVAHNRLDEVTYEFPNNPKKHKITITPSGSNTDIAFAAFIGTGIVLTDRLVLDISWRYTDLGRIYTDADRARLNNIPAGIMIAETWAPPRTHGLFTGIRYLF